MQKQVQKRRKGGGRKLADGKMSKTRLKREAIKWFTYDTSVDGFLRKVGISRPTYYRFLNKYPKLKGEIFTLRSDAIERHKTEMSAIALFYRNNPNSTLVDYYDYKLDISISQCANTPIVI